MTTVFERVINREKRVTKYYFFKESESSNNNLKENRIILKVKLQRAQGECLGTGSRRRTWLTAISHGEP